MEIWFSENHSPHVRFDIRVERQLYSAESEYQRIDVFASPEFGKFLTLDGSVIFSEQDCFIYNGGACADVGAPACREGAYYRRR